MPLIGGAGLLSQNAMLLHSYSREECHHTLDERIVIFPLVRPLGQRGSHSLLSINDLGVWFRPWRVGHALAAVLVGLHYGRFGAVTDVADVRLLPSRLRFVRMDQEEVEAHIAVGIDCPQVVLHGRSVRRGRREE